MRDINNSYKRITSDQVDGVIFRGGGYGKANMH